jgi:NAD(P)-dependent dehydrogenase (short-subunit alcohol dehydrogenase family)
MGRLEGKVAIVTGAGQGIGLAYARRFLDEGAKVAVAELDPDRAAAGMAELDGMGDAVLVQTDIGDPDSAAACAAATKDAFGRIDILVNNAAIYHDIDNADASYEYLLKIMSVNQHGAWLMARAVAPTMVEQRWGRIINQSSGAAYQYVFPPMEFTGLGNFSYSITKWGIVGLTKFMAAQLGQYGITVNCIAPGVTMTEATKKVVPDMYIGGMTAMTAMKQTLEPEDLAGAAVFFASDDARFCTGQTLVVDGGLAMPA